MLNRFMSNNFGGELELKTCDMIYLWLKLVPMILISLIARCLSFVTMVMLLKLYSIFPVFVIWLISYNTLQTIKYDQSFFYNLCNEDTDLRFAAFVNLIRAYGDTLVGPTLVPIEKLWWRQKNFSVEWKMKHDMKRKKIFLVDAITSFASHGTTMAIIIILWETTSVLDQNLSICTFPLIKNNISLICGIIMSFSAANCLLSYLYYKM